MDEPDNSREEHAEPQIHEPDRGQQEPHTDAAQPSDHRWQIDHTLLDVIVVDPETRAPLGRPWLTMVVDQRSRIPVGFHLAMEPPTGAHVAAALGGALNAEHTLDSEE